MSRIQPPGPRDQVALTLQRLFESHGIRTTFVGDIIHFPDHPALWSDGDLYSRHEHITQLDVRLGGFDGDRVLIESVVGICRDRNAQFDMAIKVFANASFHVLLPAFFGTPPCHGTERESWVIGGRSRDVYSGLG